MAKKALIVSTSAAKMGDHDTGLWSEECTGPYYTFKGEGFEVTVCSVAGGDIPVDAGSLSDTFKTENDKRSEAEGNAFLKNTPKLADQDLSSFDVVFFSGGHGTCVDFPTEEVGSAVSKAWAAGKVVAAVCHGPMCFVNAKNEAGEPLVKGKKVACFSNTEEEQVGLTGKVPFLLADKLKELGATIEGADPWSDKAVRDGNLVTGQNPQSSVSVAKLCLQDETKAEEQKPATAETPAATTKAEEPAAEEVKPTETPVQESAGENKEAKATETPVQEPAGEGKEPSPAATKTDENVETSPAIAKAEDGIAQVSAAEETFTEETAGVKAPSSCFCAGFA